jgi:3-oxoacyl-[acyl-carrier-protein] synthase II
MTNATRVVVTGVGAIAPVGHTSDELFDGLVAGHSGVRRSPLLQELGLGCQIAGEVTDFDPTKHMDRKLARRIGRYAQFALVATNEAVAQSGLDLDAEDPTRVATVVGSAIGDFPMLEKEIRKYVGGGRPNPFTVPRVSSNMASGNVSLMLGTTGPSFGISSACATGSHALAIAWLLLRAGLADVAIAGGAESAISECFLESYLAMGVLSTRNSEPERASRPFDNERDGFVLGEGSGVLVLETEEHARARGATILAEFAGIGMSADAYHVAASHPEGQGAKAAMRSALASAGVGPEAVGYVSAHGTSTRINDQVETIAIKSVLGERAPNVPVSSIKSMIGHTIGAAGALEAITCVKILERGVIPPTINLEVPDPDCDLDYVPLEARRADVDVALSNSFAFGGQNCVHVYRRYDGGPST